nr:xylulose kinase-1 [Tanacetum cinerariifolium]
MTGRDHDGRVIILPPTTAEEHIAVQRESKARTTLLQSIPDDHVVDFHYMYDARDIWNAVKTMFGDGLHKGYDRMQKILSQLNQLKANPDAEDINLKFLRALPSSWSQIALTLKTKGGLEFLSFDDLYYKLKTLDVDVKGYNTFSSSQSVGDAREFALMGVTSERVLQRNQLTLEDKIRVLSIELENTSNLLKHSERINADFETDKKDLQTKLDNHLVQTEKWRNSSKNLFRLIDSSMSVRTKVGLGFTNYISENELGWDDSAFSIFTTNSEDVKGRPSFHRFAKTDSMKAVPPPLFGDYTFLSDHIDLDESQMSYGTKSSTSCDSKYVSYDFVSCDDSDKSSEVNTNNFASSDSSVKSLEHQPNDSTSCASTSSDLPSFSCNKSDKNVYTSRTSCNKNGYFNKKACHFRKNASSVSKLCFVCGSGTHLIKDCDFYEKRMANKTVGIGVGPVHSKNKVNHQNQFVPQAVLLRTGKVVCGKHLEKVYTGYPRTIVDLIHLHTDDNMDDLLTKPLDRPRGGFESKGRTVVVKFSTQLLVSLFLLDLVATIVGCYWFGCSCCWNKDAILELTSADLSRILKLTMLSLGSCRHLIEMGPKCHVVATWHLRSKTGEVDINTLTMKQYLALTHENQEPGVVKPKIGGNVNFEIKCQFMRELREDTFLGVSHDVVMLHVFRITLIGAAKRWVDMLPPETINTWDMLKRAFIQRDWKHSTMADHIHKWHDRSNSRKDAKLVEELILQRIGNSAKYRVGPSGYYTRVDNHPPFGKKKPNLEELMNNHLEESTRRRAKMKDWIKKLQESTNMNIRNQNASLMNLETQIAKLTKDGQIRVDKEILSSSTSVGHCKSIFSDNDNQDKNVGASETNVLHWVSFNFDGVV